MLQYCFCAQKQVQDTHYVMKHSNKLQQACCMYTCKHNNIAGKVNTILDYIT